MRRRSRIAALALVLAVAAGAGAGIARRCSRRPGPAAPPSPAGAPRPAGLPGAPAAPPAAARVLTPAPLWLAPAEGPARPAPSGAVEGRVVSALDGRPVRGAHLTFARAEEAAPVPAGPDGAFRFEPRAPGRWALAAVTAPGFQPFAPPWGHSPVSVEARAGAVVRGLTVALAPEARWLGRVVDEAGAPVAGAEVRLLGGAAGEAVVPLPDRFTSAADGTFTFVAPEGALLEARREGFAPGRARVDHAVRVAGRLTLRLQRAGPALGVIEGLVEDAAGAPAAGARVEAQARERPDAAEARTGEDGRFRLEGLAPGGWWLTASRPGAAPAAAPAQAGDRDVRLRLGRGGVVAGAVRDRRTGAPIPAFTVLVQATALRQETFVDAAGRYALEDLAPGEAVLAVVAPGYAPSAEVRVAVPPAGAAPAAVDFQLAPGGRLPGQVVERGTGRPLPGAQVELEGPPAEAAAAARTVAVAGPDGRFELAGVPEQPAALFAAAAGHHARVLQVPGVPGGETGAPVRLELTPVGEGEEPRIELAGIGAQLAREGPVLRVVQVLPGGGAAEAGLAPGDAVLAVDGVDVAGLGFGEAIGRLRGPEGSRVVLTVRRGGEGQALLPLEVVRRLVRN